MPYKYGHIVNKMASVRLYYDGSFVLLSDFLHYGYSCDSDCNVKKKCLLSKT